MNLKIAPLEFVFLVTHGEEASYLLCGFAVVRSSGNRDQRRPVLQKHLPLAHVTPDPECCQVHRQVVLLSLKKGDTYTYNHSTDFL